MLCELLVKQRAVRKVELQGCPCFQLSVGAGLLRLSGMYAASGGDNASNGRTRANIQLALALSFL
jgi:hypothetical protein